MSKLTFCLILLSGVFLTYCSSGQMQPREPVTFDLAVCDEKAMDLPAPPRGRQWADTDMVQVKTVRQIQKAQADCGNAALDYGDANREVAVYNYDAALHNQPDGFFEQLKDGLIWFAGGALTVLAIVAAAL